MIRRKTNKKSLVISPRIKNKLFWYKTIPNSDVQSVYTRYITPVYRVTILWIVDLFEDFSNKKKLKDWLSWFKELFTCWQWFTLFINVTLTTLSPSDWTLCVHFGQSYTMYIQCPIRLSARWKYTTI